MEGSVAQSSLHVGLCQSPWNGPSLHLLVLSLQSARASSTLCGQTIHTHKTTLTFAQMEELRLFLVQGSTFGTPGVEEHALFLRDVANATAIRSKLIKNWMLANIPGKCTLQAFHAYSLHLTNSSHLRRSVRTLEKASIRLGSNWLESASASSCLVCAQLYKGNVLLSSFMAKSSFCLERIVGAPGCVCTNMSRWKVSRCWSSYTPGACTKKPPRLQAIASSSPQLASVRACAAGRTDVERCRLLHCVVVGGGPTGVEFAGELTDLIRKDLAKIDPLRAADIKYAWAVAFVANAHLHAKIVSLILPAEFSQFSCRIDMICHVQSCK